MLVMLQALGELDWVPGDAYALRIPAHAEALRAGGTRFLTETFRISGALRLDNRVARITRFEDCAGGSTGRKLLLSVEYEKPESGLHSELFVKFSRDFDDPIRDRGRGQMEREVRFAQLSRRPGFPIVVPACCFADFHRESGTGLLITERIGFGCDGVEPQYEKCRDHEMPEALAHYEALITALARLAGAHQSGRLPAEACAPFPFELDALSVGERPPYTAEQLRRRVARYAEFAQAHPQLLPGHVRAPDFITRFGNEVVRVAARDAAIKDMLRSRPELVALCHWNANVDNAWFRRGAGGRIECGLLDWGCVSQMNLAMALWGALSAADTQIFGELDALLARFIAELRRCGGAALDAAVLRQHFVLYAAMMGTAWLLDAPAYICKRVPDLAHARSALDPCIQNDEVARVQLQMLTNVLHLWQTHDVGYMLDVAQHHI